VRPKIFVRAKLFNVFGILGLFCGFLSCRQGKTQGVSPVNVFDLGASRTKCFRLGGGEDMQKAGDVIPVTIGEDLVRPLPNTLDVLFRQEPQALPKYRCSRQRNPFLNPHRSTSRFQTAFLFTKEGINLLSHLILAFLRSFYNCLAKLDLETSAGPGLTSPQPVSTDKRLVAALTADQPKNSTRHSISRLFNGQSA
jgi:hypothetical protein